jgi:hypothetical protein
MPRDPFAVGASVRERERATNGGARYPQAASGERYVRIPRRLDPEQRSRLLELGETIAEDAYRDDDGGFFERLRSAFR